MPLSESVWQMSDWDGDIYWTGDINEPDRKQIETVYPNRPFPVYKDTDMKYSGERMNPIGFVARGSDIKTDYRMNAGYNSGNEMEHKSSSKMIGGYSSDMSAPMTREIADEWMAGLKNEDGSKGPHWKMDQVKQLMAQKGIQHDPIEFWVVLNMLYSDYCSVFKKHNCNNIDVYTDLASAWLNDSDAMPDKLAKYYDCVVKK